MPALNFLDIEPRDRKYERSKFVVIPVSYEATTTYGAGTKHAPAAILAASQQVENFDEALLVEPYRVGIHTQGNCSVRSLLSMVQCHLGKGKIPVILGGEHSITPLVVTAFAKHYKSLSVLQLDAHTDLRDSYRGTKDNHACVMRRVLEICPAVQVGIRSLAKEEWDFAQRTGQSKKIHWARYPLSIKQIKKQLSKNVYITIDVDVFDPAVAPAVGTPEPGGLAWSCVLSLLREICQTKNVVGFDVVELCPKKDDRVSDFTVARLVYKIIGYIG